VAVRELDAAQALAVQVRTAAGGVRYNTQAARAVLLLVLHAGEQPPAFRARREYAPPFVSLGIDVDAPRMLAAACRAVAAQAAEIVEGREADVGHGRGWIAGGIGFHSVIQARLGRVARIGTGSSGRHMVKVGIIGGTGYTGVELLRLLAVHPQIEFRVITLRGEAGWKVADLIMLVSCG
jgi:hypothetical protein